MDGGLVERADARRADRRARAPGRRERAHARAAARRPPTPRASSGPPGRSTSLLALLAPASSLLPVFVLVALLVKLTWRGPVFYPQERVGLDRRLPGPGAHNHRRARTSAAGPFTIYKFRTMRVDAEQPQRARSGPSSRTPGSPRWAGCCASTGWTSCPSCSTCSRGEMNIVGPRPERPTIFAELREPHRRVPAAPAGQAGHHRAGPDQPPLRPLDRRRAHQGELRPGVHPPPEPARRPPHHAQDHPRHPPPPRRLVSSRRTAGDARRPPPSFSPVLLALAIALRFWRLGHLGIRRRRDLYPPGFHRSQLSNPRPLLYLLNYYLVLPLQAARRVRPSNHSRSGRGARHPHAVFRGTRTRRDASGAVRGAAAYGQPLHVY